MELGDREQRLIDGYLLGNLSENEQKEFAEIEKDPTFRQELKLQSSMYLALERNEDASLKKILSDEENRIKKKGGLVISLRNIGTIAAALVLLLGAFFFLWPKENNNNLYASHFEPYPNVVIPIDRSKTKDFPIAEAFRLYEAGDYEKAITGFTSVAANHQTRFYTANAYMAIENYTEALELFQILSRENKQFSEQSVWYSALCYLKLGEKENAIDMFSKLSSIEGGYRQNDALNILQKLK